MTTTIHGWATESATAPPVERVTESGAITSSGGRFMITLITPGRGSSGYFAPEVLEAAAAARTFPAGTQMHVDHSTETESRERGVRSVQTLAAVLTEDARWDGQALVAEARPIGLWGQQLRDMADVIGVSISSSATWGAGNGPDGLPGVIESLLPSPLNTVDFVSVPGRGGSFQVLEAARAEEARTVATFLEARTHRYLNELFADMYGDGRLSREEWDVLQVAAASAVASITGAIAALPGLSSRDIWDDAPTNSPAVEAGAPKTNPAGDSTIQGTPHQEDDMPQIEQAELDQLRESAGRAEALATENATLKADAEKRETEAKEARVAAAEQVVKEAFGEDAPAFIVESAKHAAEQGTFDEKAVREAAQAAEAHRAGQPQHMGQVAESGAAGSTTTRTDADWLAALDGKVA